jgi:ATP-dependent Clp protease ATP-binding subunit ClpC
VTPRAKRFLVNKGFDAQMGARPLRRAVERYLAEPLSEEILKGAFAEGDLVVVDVLRGALQFKKKEKKGAGTSVS